MERYSRTSMAANAHIARSHVVPTSCPTRRALLADGFEPDRDAELDERMTMVLIGIARAQRSRRRRGGDGA